MGLFDWQGQPEGIHTLLSSEPIYHNLSMLLKHFPCGLNGNFPNFLVTGLSCLMEKNAVYPNKVNHTDHKPYFTPSYTGQMKLIQIMNQVELFGFSG